MVPFCLWVLFPDILIDPWLGENVEWPLSGLSVAATNKFEESETLSKAKDGQTAEKRPVFFF